MTTRDNLIFHLQDLYSFNRDVLPLVDEMHHECGNERLRGLLQQQRDGMKSEMEILERALSVLGARYKMEHSTLGPALKEGMQRFKHQVNPSREQLDISALVTIIKVLQMEIGAYQGYIELARAIGEQDVTTLLEENLSRQTEGVNALRAFASPFIQEITRSEARRAA